MNFLLNKNVYVKRPATGMTKTMYTPRIKLKKPLRDFQVVPGVPRSKLKS